jgi:hypothetical protein
MDRNYSTIRHLPLAGSGSAFLNLIPSSDELILIPIRPMGTGKAAYN